MVAIIAKNKKEAEKVAADLGLKDFIVIGSPESMHGLHKVNYIFARRYYMRPNIDRFIAVARESVCCSGGMILFEGRK